MDYRIFSIKSRTLIKPASKKRRVKTADFFFFLGGGVGRLIGPPAFDQGPSGMAETERAWTTVTPAGRIKAPWRRTFAERILSALESLPNGVIK